MGNFPGRAPAFRQFRITKTSKAPAEADENLTADMARAFEKHSGLGTLKSPCLVTGKSGVRHSFTFGYGEVPDVKVVGDVVVNDEPVDETKVLSLFIKVYDVGARHAVLCVVPSLTPEAKKLSGLYKIVTVEAGDKGRLPGMASDVLQRLSKS